MQPLLFGLVTLALQLSAIALLKKNVFLIGAGLDQVKETLNHKHTASGCLSVWEMRSFHKSVDCVQRNPSDMKGEHATKLKGYLAFDQPSWIFGNLLWSASKSPFLAFHITWCNLKFGVQPFSCIFVLQNERARDQQDWRFLNRLCILDSRFTRPLWGHVRRSLAGMGSSATGQAGQALLGPKKWWILWQHSWGQHNTSENKRRWVFRW